MQLKQLKQLKLKLAVNNLFQQQYQKVTKPTKRLKSTIKSTA